MKKILLFIAVLLCCLPSMLVAQTFYGLTAGGGINGGGAVIKYETATNSLSSEFSFSNDPKYPSAYGKMLKASNGKLYGMTTEGGIGYGTIFSFDPANNTQVQLADFNLVNGAAPNGNLIETSDGRLFGMASRGGANNKGVIFSFDITTNTIVKSFDFSGTNGAYPVAALLQATDGKLYGMTQSGGTNVNQLGTLFSYDPVKKELINLFDFDGDNGSVPFGSLIQATNGQIYGMTFTGGSGGAGTIFSYDPANKIVHKLYDFQNSAAGFPMGSLVQASNGKLYGLTSSSGSDNNFSGTIFSFDPALNIVTQLFGFDGANGSNPFGDFLLASDGNLYSTTNSGGTNGLGTIFSFNINTNVTTKLVDFDSNDGANHFGSLVQSGKGSLYGLTIYGGSTASGTIFSFDPVSHQKAILYSFNTTNLNSTAPTGSLVSSANGKLFGASYNGGTNNKGTIFSFDPATKTQTKVTDFTGVNGAYPSSGGTLVGAANNKLYGTTNSGGAGNFGTLFSFDPSTNVQTKLYEFDNNGGQYPSGSLLKAKDGKLYGVTQLGGVDGIGTLYSFDPTSNAKTLLFSFNYSSGYVPYSEPIQATDGLLYGTTPYGSGNVGNGTIYSFDILSNTFATRYVFNDVNIGNYPYAPLFQASNGKMYGMTLLGGSANIGTLFSFDPVTNTCVKIVDFIGSNGSYPGGSLVEGQNGNLLGMTSGGGSLDLGILYSYNINSNIFTKLKDFDGANGASPSWGAALLPVVTGIPPVVTITSPSSPAIAEAGSNLTIKAKATDADGTILKTELFINGTYSQTDSTAPYVFKINGIEPDIYKITVKATDNTGQTAVSDTTIIKVAECKGSGTITAYGYTNIKGAQLLSLILNPAYPNRPSIVTALTSFEYANVGDNYGGRLRGYICAPVTGKYVFNIAADDQAGLFLSTDKDPGNKVLIAFTASATKFREWNKYSTQKSKPVRLIKGATYYIETLHKEAAGTDHLSVAWTIPGGIFEGPIPGSRLSPWLKTAGASARASFSLIETGQKLDGLKVTVMPNPSSSFFNLSITSSISKPVTLKISDAAGRIVESKSNLSPNGSTQVGYGLAAGIYFVEVIQNGERQQLKLVKQ